MNIEDSETKERSSIRSDEDAQLLQKLESKLAELHDKLNPQEKQPQQKIPRHQPGDEPGDDADQEPVEEEPLPEEDEDEKKARLEREELELQNAGREKMFITLQT